MRQASFHPELQALLDDPIIGSVLASDGMAMRDLVALLEQARGRLNTRPPAAPKAKGRRKAGPR
jgi:hypothetical protein